MTKVFFPLILLGLASVLFANPLQLPEYEREIKILFPNEAAAKAATLEPLAPGETATVAVEWSGRRKTVLYQCGHLNGNPLDIGRLPERISGHAGKNRLVARYAATGGPRLLSVSSEESPNDPVTFVHK